MPYFNYCPQPYDLSPEEFTKVLSLRLSTLEDATREAGMGEPLPVPWRWGWRAYVDIQGRDRDGSLIFAVNCEGNGGEHRYTRRYRLVREQRLPSRLGRD